MTSGGNAVGDLISACGADQFHFRHWDIAVRTLRLIAENLLLAGSVIGLNGARRLSYKGFNLMLHLGVHLSFILRLEQLSGILECSSLEACTLTFNHC